MTTQQREKKLKQGRVPSAPIVALIREWLSESGVGPEDDTSEKLIELSRWSGVSYDTLYDNVGRERGVTFDFNDADAILCAIGRFDSWYQGELLDIYTRVALDRHVCGRAGCQKLVPEEEQFCGLLCESAAQEGGSERKYSRRKPECPQGHVRTEANTHVTPSGSRQCLDCVELRYDAKYQGVFPRRGGREPVESDSYGRPVAAC